MTAPSDEDRRLRVLHEDYAWKVNAAVAEGREDLIPCLVAAYEAEALRLMAEEHRPACGRYDCAVCARRRAPAAPVRPALSWWVRARRYLIG